MPRVVFILAALLGSVGCTPGSECGPTKAIVAAVIDGDTIELDSGERIRYLLVDTPESVNGADDCFGSESAQFNRDLVEGKEVRLRYDDSGTCTDRFDRLLAYVDIDDREVNRLLVERGFACTLFVAPAGADRRAEFETLESMARQAGRGLWGACEEVTCD